MERAPNQESDFGFLFSSPTQWSCAPGKSLWDSAFWSPNLKNEDKSYPDHLTKQL